MDQMYVFFKNKRIYIIFLIDLFD